MENDLYTVVINGKPQGPYTTDQLSALNVQPGTFLRKPGMDDYKEAHEFPELRALLGFSYQRTAPQYFASFDQRLLASVIDYFFIFLIYVSVLLVVFMVVEEKESRIMFFAGFSPLILVVKYLYGCIEDASVRQGTIGKRLLRIRVSDEMGSRISLKQSFIRNSAKLLSSAPVFFGYLYSFLNRRKQCWHDVVANTLVIKDRLI